MLLLWQAVAFTACALMSLVPKTQVDCRLGGPVLTWSAPPAVATLEPAPTFRTPDPPPAPEAPVQPAAVR